MNRGLAKDALAISQAIQDDARDSWSPPPEGLVPRSDLVLLRSLTLGTRGHIEKIVDQINGSYENGWYDACAVMTRRLIETLLIEAFEHHHVDHLIKSPSGEFMSLGDIITVALTYPGWNLSRDTKRALPKLKAIGDKSAHNRRFTAHRGDVDRIISDLRVVVQELVYLAALK